MKKLYIIGARGMGREIYGLFEECRPVLGDVECVGFLDDKADALGGFEGYPPVVGTVERFVPDPDDVFVCALGDPRWQRYYSGIMERKGGKFISLISPNAVFGRNISIGAGSMVSGGCFISSDVTIGEHCCVGIFSVIGHDVRIGTCCHLGAYTFLGGRSVIKDRVTIHPRVTVIPDRVIGDDAVLGVGSVVIRNVRPATTVFGNPARKI